jgi:TRAP transporter TAXI family solute receptor
MKKTLVLILSLILVASAFAGCSSKDATTTEGSASNETEKTLDLAFATGGTSGTYYPLGGAIANVWNDKIAGINVTIQPAGASVENINRVASGEVDLVLAMNNIADQAFKGEGDSFPNALTNFKAIGVVYPEVMHVITTKNSGINSIADLQGKKINPGPPGSGTYVTAMEILKAFNVDDYSSSPGSFSDAVAGLQDGNIDAAFAVVSFPSSAVVEIATARDVKILEITGDELAKLQESIPFAAPFTVTGGEYNGQDEDAQTIALQAVLYAKDTLDAELVYNLTKEMYENTDAIAAGHARGKQISIDRALDGITTDVHEGAQKYYDEVK